MWSRVIRVPDVLTIPAQTRINDRFFVHQLDKIDARRPADMRIYTTELCNNSDPGARMGETLKSSNNDGEMMLSTSS